MRKTRFASVLRAVAAALHPLLRRDNVWLFCNHSSKPWCGNLKAMCDAAARNGRLRKIIILNWGKTPSQEIERQYASAPVPVQVLRKEKLKQFFAALTADVIFVHEYGKYGLPNYSVNLWHGIPLKRIGIYKNPVRGTKQAGRSGYPEKTLANPKQYNLHQKMISSSPHDRVVMSACFAMHPDHVVDSGLPRNDWLDPSFELPREYRDSLDALNAKCGGKALCLYAPTFRDEDREWSPVSREELTELAALLGKYGMILGVRPHILVRSNFFEGITNCLDLSSRAFPEIQIILRHAEMLVTDYSSCALDFMLQRRPTFSYAPDIEEYSRGFLYDLESVFPGPVIRTFGGLLQKIEQVLTDPAAREDCLAASDRVLPLFHKPGRTRISENLVEYVLRERRTRITVKR